MTAAATLATAPLIAFHFGEVSTVTLVANLLALPAVAPAMWLGMLAAAAGQVPGLPGRGGQPARAPAARLRRPGRLLVRAAVLGLGRREPRAGRPDRLLRGDRGGRAAASRGCCAASPHRVPGRRGGRARPLDWSRSRSLAALVARRRDAGRLAGAGPPPAGLRITVLDVGQGDAILLQPAAAPRDPGRRRAARRRPGAQLRRGRRRAPRRRRRHPRPVRSRRRHRGAARRAADRDARLRRSPAAACSGEAARRGRAAEPGRRGGDRCARAASASTFVWPPPSLLDGSHAGEDPNRLALVVVARWGRFSMLLSADAEAESTPIDPGPVDVLKVAHHGSEDAGLDGLLERTMPRLAVISVGEDNPYGHPTAATLATLASHGVPHPAHRPRRRGRHRGARHLGGGPRRSLSATLPDGSPTEYSEFRHATLAASSRAADATTR